MIVREIIEQFNFLEFWKKFIIIYPEEKNWEIAYYNLYKNLLKQKVILNEMTVCINRVQEIYNNKDIWINIYGEYNKKNIDCKWLLSEMNSNEFLGMEINNKVFKNFSKLEILCYILYEFSYNNFSNNFLINQILIYYCKFIDFIKGVK